MSNQHRSIAATYRGIPVASVNYSRRDESYQLMKPRRYESTAVHNNMHGYRGIEWEQSRGKFRARIEPANGKRGRWLGRFDTAVSAAHAYDEAARETYGEHACLNFPRTGEKQSVASKLNDGFCPKGHDLSIHGYKHARGINCRKCNAASKRRKTQEIALTKAEKHDSIDARPA